MGKDYMPKIYLMIGILFSLLFGLMVFSSIMAKAGPLSQTYLLFALAVMSFSLSYLYPHLKQKDERANMIRQKGMFYSYFALIGYYIVLLFIVQFNILPLSTVDVLNILIALTICTVFLSWVFLAKRY